MATVPAGQFVEPQAGALLIDCLVAHGSRSHPYAASLELLSGPESARNLADAIHFLCALHGRQPGLIEIVAMRSLEPEARGWLGDISDAFARERGFLARLSVAAGPVPATPGGGGEAAVATQRNALMTLAQSERRGCALGAALAFAADWSMVRAVLDAAASRFGMAVPAPWPADSAAAAETAERAARSVAIRRAILFGAEQVALQHRGLWDLLYARQLARKAPAA